MSQAYDDLDEATKQRLDGLKAVNEWRHIFPHLRQQKELYVFLDEKWPAWREPNAALSSSAAAVR